MPGNKCSWDVWSPQLHVLVTRALFSFITWRLLLKGRTKGEIQGSCRECSKKGTLRTSLRHKRSWKTCALHGFLGVLHCPKSWRVCKMHMPRWKQWPKLYSHSRTRSLHAPLSTTEVFVGLVPKWAFCGLERKGNKVKANSLLHPPPPVGSFPLLRDTSCEDPGTKKVSETWQVA